VTSELFARFVVYFTQLGIALLLCYLLWHFSRIYRQEYIKCWFAALLCFALYQSAILIQGAAGLGAGTGVIPSVFQFLLIFSSYAFAMLLLRGMVMTRHDKQHLLLRVKLLPTLLLLAVIALLSVVPFAVTDAFASWQLYFQLYIRLLLMGIVLLTAAVGLWQRMSPTLGQRLAVVTLILWGLLYVGNGIWLMLAERQEEWSYWILLYKSAELFLLCCLGLSLIMWLQEHERSTNAQLTEKAHYLNRYDQLTGALNRDALLSVLNDQLRQEKAAPLHLLMLGLDKFKTVNESVGLKQGDEILRQLIRRFEQSVLKPALIARTGGDIFTLVITDVHNDTQLLFTIRHLQQLVEKSFVLDCGSLKLSCSIGLARFPQHATNAEQLVQKANIAFHQAKRMQSRWLEYQPGMEDETSRLISWETELLAAMEHNQFVLYFQPQCCARSNSIEAFEVLLRWQHPQKGFLMPGQFLPFVEQLGLNRQLDLWVLRKAVLTISLWKQQHLHIPLAVNMSPVNFQQDGLKREIQRLLMQYKVSPDLLELEITENTAMHDMEKGSNYVMELQQLGIRVSIDDFGTGYSSLAYLRRMPIDKIKIDRSFVMDMAGNDSDMMIVKTMIKLAHGLGKRILAEGVETAVQLQLLQNMSCDAVQGYYLAKPLTEADAIAFYRSKMSL
jgi:diguanylate cyclase (GGDEF)-like protein